jgi:hypothetical protein
MLAPLEEALRADPEKLQERAEQSSARQCKE